MKVLIFTQNSRAGTFCRSHPLPSRTLDRVEFLRKHPVHTQIRASYVNGSCRYQLSAPGWRTEIETTRLSYYQLAKLIPVRLGSKVSEFCNAKGELIVVLY